MNAQQSFVIRYRGVPISGLFIGKNKFGECVFMGLNWPDRARQWLPMIDHPSDKATTEFIVTAPARFQVVANGLLVEETDIGDGRRRTHWKQSVPISSWLNAIGVAQFSTHHAGLVNGVALQTWVYHQDSARGPVTFELPTRRALEFFTEHIGPYSYQKLANVESAGMGGGTEHASVIFYGESSVTDNPATNLVAHEIAHQWFGHSPCYSADGEWIVFTRERDGQADIYRVHPDGSALEQLTKDPAFDDQGSLSPDGRTLAFVSSRHGGTANVWLMDLGTRKTKNLTASHGANFRPAWSPDGKWIAFSSDRGARAAAYPGSWEQMQSTGIYLISRDGSGLRRLTRKGGVAGSPSWSADGRQVVFYETDEVGAYMAKSVNTRIDIASVDVTTGAHTSLWASNDTKLSPAFQPGRRFSFIKRAADSTAGLRLFTLGQRTVITVVHGAVRNPSWSPDGAHVAFQRISRLGTTQHLVPTVSRDAAFDLVRNEPFPELSPDGSKLLFSQLGEGQSTGSG